MSVAGSSQQKSNERSRVRTVTDQDVVRQMKFPVMRVVANSVDAAEFAVVQKLLLVARNWRRMPSEAWPWTLFQHSFWHARMYHCRQSPKSCAGPLLSYSSKDHMSTILFDLSFSASTSCAKCELSKNSFICKKESQRTKLVIFEYDIIIYL